MHSRVILRVTGALLMLFSVTLLTPILVALIYGEDATTFVVALGITLLTGVALWLGGRGGADLRSRDGFLITVLFYLGVGLFGAIPIYLAPGVTSTFTNAAFESLSGLTTTGATVLVGLDELPKAILFYRQLLQWLGGMGIIVLAVAVLPMLGVGGMQLYRAESPGPVKDTKLTPRITETAKALWYLYLGMTLSCAFLYWVSGMDAFDALCHSFSTVAIGGFSTHDASIAYFDSAAIETVAIVFMIIAGINFGLHFTAFQRRSLRYYVRSPEVRFYLFAIIVIATIVTATLFQHSGASNRALRDGIFQTVSMITTTGFTTDNYSLWPTLTPVLLLFAAFAGGCAGSTAGGIKMVRVLLILRQGLREIKRLIHPNGIFPIKLGDQVVSDRVIDAVWGFFAFYIIIFLTMVCVLLGISDLDFVTAFSAIGATLNNLGPGLGGVALNYASTTDLTKWLLMFAMLLGRLEIFTLLVLLTPAYWRS